MTTRWAGSAPVPDSTRSRLANSPIAADASHLPPPPSYQVATQSMTSPSKHFTRHLLHRHQQQHTPVTSAHEPVTSSFPGSVTAATVAAHDRKMSFQIDPSTWKDREPTHFRWNMMAVAKTDNQGFHHALPTSYDEVTYIHTYIHNKSYSAQSYIKTERLCITKVQTYTK